MVLIFPSTNPSSKTIMMKQRGNNALATTPNAMPMKFYPSDPDHPQLHRKYVSTLKRCKIIEIHPGDNGTKIPSLQPV